MSLAKAAQDSAHQSLQTLIHAHNAQQQRDHERAQARDAKAERARKLRRNLAIGATAATGLAAAGGATAGYLKGKKMGTEAGRKAYETPENWIKAGLNMTGGRGIKVKMGNRVTKDKTGNPLTGWRRTPTVKTDIYKGIEKENRFKTAGRGPIQYELAKSVGPGTRFGQHELCLALARGRANNLSPSALRKIVEMHDTTAAQQSIAEAARVR